MYMIKPCTRRHIYYIREGKRIKTMARFPLLLAVVLFRVYLLINAYFASGGLTTIQSDLNKALYGHSFRNFSGLKMEKCLEYCLANCLCLSFQICDNTRECQLCSTNKYLIPEAMQQRDGCTSFNFKDQDEVGNQQCGKGCTRVIDCCMTSSPCLNGGTCLPPLSSGGKRFRCKCRDGYEGERCHHEVKLCKPGYTGQQCEHRIRSCRGYTNGSRISGNYTVLDSQDDSFKVYCDFTRNSSTTWTLIQSYSLENNDIFKGKPFSKELRRNENAPSWLKYRLRKSRMASIQADSTRWRVTCRYETDGVVYRDYLGGSKVQLDILDYNTETCNILEYINVRGYSCTNCKVFLSQKHNALLYVRRKHGCFPPATTSTSCSGDRERNFGNYRCADIQHRCASSNDATTQTWIGAD